MVLSFVPLLFAVECKPLKFTAMFNFFPII